MKQINFYKNKVGVYSIDDVSFIVFHGDGTMKVFLLNGGYIDIDITQYDWFNVL